MTNNILVIDDEKDFLTSVRRALTAEGFSKVTLLNDPYAAAELLQREEPFDVALIDMTMPGMNGMDVLERIKDMSPSTECIMITARNEARIAVECLRKGAYDYLVKPISSDDMIMVIRRALERKRLLEIVDLTKYQCHTGLTNPAAFKAFITSSPKMKILLREAELHAASELPVLISGESGTGKELLARAIHAASPRAGNVFTPINMASLSENLFESAFFGHAKGAFTGAQDEHVGFLEYTNGGTLFLDEIAILPLDLQGKLLRMLQEKEFIKLGTNKPRSADVRFVAATNDDLQKLMARGLFRKDIYYRLRGAQLHLPSLRERKEDIPLLISHFIGELFQENKNPQVTEEVMATLMEYSFPGNVRELKAVVQAAANLCRGDSITLDMLPRDIPRLQRRNRDRLQEKNRAIVPLAELEKDHIHMVFKETGGNLTRTADLLGICLNTLRKKLREYGIR